MICQKGIFYQLFCVGEFEGIFVLFQEAIKNLLDFWN